MLECFSILGFDLTNIQDSSSWTYGRNSGRRVVMKVSSSVKRRSKDCQIVRRKGKVFIINKKNPRFKQRQG